MNLRKDHYRLLVFTDLLQLKPPRVSGRAAFGLLVRALELRLACRRSQRLRLTARSNVGRLGEDGPRLPRYRTPFERCQLLKLWDVQRFKELPPRPGFVCLLGVRLPFLARTAGQSSSLLPALHVCECADFIFIILTFLSSVFKTIAWNCCDLVWQM